MTDPGPNTPLRLADAIEHAFPFGGMTVSGLRREAARGRLVIERIAGKDFTTLAEIEAMRERCRVPAERKTPRARTASSDSLLERAWDKLPDSVTKGQSLSQAAFFSELKERKKSK